AGAPANEFVLNNYYKVTVNGEVKDVQCTVAHQLTVTYTVKAADLAAGARKIQVTAVVEATAPVKSTAPDASNVASKTAEIDTEAGNKATVTINGTANWAVGTYKLYVANGTTAAATVELAEAGKVLTFTNVTGLTKVETSFYLTFTEAEKTESDKSGVIKITPTDKVIAADPKNILGTIVTDSTAAGVSIKSIVVKDSEGNAVAPAAEMAAGDYTLVVTPNAAAKTTAPATVTLSGVTAKGTAVVAGTPSWGSTTATSTIVTIDAGSAVAEANTITYTFTVAAATGSSNTTVTPVVTIETSGAVAELTATVSFTLSSSPVANPGWASGDKVVFSDKAASGTMEITATYDGSKWNCTGAPAGYTATFDGETLKITADEVGEVDPNPFKTITATPTIADSSVDAATVGTPEWNAGVDATAKA
ncbi:MAG: hypothetical protein HFF52_05750, partial [Lawsonibacter sp.]|nr:hypothetical protein [Lawsonibacter sp.]